jgi:uncharacterized LabA/DUF88 family protein
VIAHPSQPVTLEPRALRAYYYTSQVADDLTGSREELWALGFSPQVFKKVKGQEKSKGVDIALAKDLLSHAHGGNYEVAVLVAGDGDYVPLVEEVKRLGKLVYIQLFPSCGLNPELRLAWDAFFDLEKSFLANWAGYSSPP